MARIYMKRLIVFVWCWIVGIVALVYLASTQGQNIEKFRRLSDYIQTKTTLLSHSSKGSTKDKGIPKIIHQIWNDDLIPAVFQDNIRGLVTHNKPPDWSYYFWTGQSGAELIKKIFPKLLDRFQQASAVLKADILRLVVLYHYGGAYFDLDTVSVKPLDIYVETHDCTLVTDPPEHTFFSESPKPRLLITNSAMLCKPYNWFILQVIRQIENQSVACKDAISCTGPLLITKTYEHLQTTNRSKDLPVIDDYRYFEDMVDHPVQGGHLNRHCKEPFPTLKHEWSKDICRNWIKRGREKRNISDMAFTYHTWFHTYFPKPTARLRAGVNINISDIVPHVVLFRA